MSAFRRSGAEQSSAAVSTSRQHADLVSQISCSQSLRDPTQIKFEEPVIKDSQYAQARKFYYDVEAAAGGD